MIYYLKHNIHKLNWTIIGNVLGMVLIAQACLMPHQALGYKLPVQVYQAKSVCNAA